MNTERGQDHDGQWVWQAKWQAGKQKACRTALQADTAGGLSARHRPHDKRPQIAGLAASTTAATDDVGLPCR